MRSRRSSGEPGLRVGDGLAVDAVLRFSGAIGEAVTFRTVSETELISRLIRAGASPGQAELLVPREWAVRAGENERLTGGSGASQGTSRGPCESSCTTSGQPSPEARLARSTSVAPLQGQELLGGREADGRCEAVSSV